MVCRRVVVVGAATAGSAGAGGTPADKFTTDALLCSVVLALVEADGVSRVSRAMGVVTTLGSMRMAGSFAHRVVRPKDLFSGRNGAGSIACPSWRTSKWR